MNDPDTAAAEIDRVLSDCVLQSRPVYIALPTDVTYMKVSSDRLRVPLPRIPTPNDTLAEAAVIKEIVKLIEEANGDVAILVDVGAVRYNAVEEVKAFVEGTGLPVYAAPMGKSVISEQYERYGGVSFLPDPIVLSLYLSIYSSSISVVLRVPKLRTKSRDRS